MRIIAKSTLEAFWVRPGRGWAEQPLKSWIAFTKKAAWNNPADVKRTFNSADHLKEGRMIFDVGGNKIRIIVMINYKRQIVYIRCTGTHAEYDAIDPDII